MHAMYVASILGGLGPLPHRQWGISATAHRVIGLAWGAAELVLFENDYSRQLLLAYRLLVASLNGVTASLTQAMCTHNMCTHNPF